MGLIRRFGRSIFGGPVVPRNDRERAWVVLNHLVLHMRPALVPRRALRFTQTWGLGGICLVLISLLMATGVLLMFVYEPSTERAYLSIGSLRQDVLFGELVRNIHYWSANFLVAAALGHLLRTFLTGAFHGPRRFNWVIGLMLLFCVLAANFTGYLLPWDQLSYWAITICTGMIGYVPGIGAWLVDAVRGGPEIGQATLTAFYTIHTTVVPVCLVLFMAFHFWRVRKAGGIALPQMEEKNPLENHEKIPAWPNLLMRELTAGFLVVALVMVLAFLFDAPLGDAANTGMSPNPAKAPWYFAGFQELLLHFHPLVAALLFPLAGTVALLLIPYLRYDTDQPGVWFLTPKGRRMGIAAAITAFTIIPAWIVLDEFAFDAVCRRQWSPAWISHGLLPTGMLIAALAAFHFTLKRRYSATNDEAGQAVFIFLAAAFLVLTLAGSLFRGTGMALVWPWNT